GSSEEGRSANCPQMGSPNPDEGPSATRRRSRRIAGDGRCPSAGAWGELNAPTVPRYPAGDPYADRDVPASDPRATRGPTSVAGCTPTSVRQDPSPP
ncbi:hypothetical protein IscW_ISCW006827, partial [Ixodes scapularis]